MGPSRTPSKGRAPNKETLSGIFANITHNLLQINKQFSLIIPVMLLQHTHTQNRQFNNCLFNVGFDLKDLNLNNFPIALTVFNYNKVQIDHRQ